MPALSTVMAGGKDGFGYMKRNKLVGLALIFGTFVSSYYVWHRIVGFNKQAYFEQQYAHNVKSLRNLLIKQ